MVELHCNSLDGEGWEVVIGTYGYTPCGTCTNDAETKYEGSASIQSHDTSIQYYPPATIVHKSPLLNLAVGDKVRAMYKASGTYGNGHIMQCTVGEAIELLFEKEYWNGDWELQKGTIACSGSAGQHRLWFAHWDFYETGIFYYHWIDKVVVAHSSIVTFSGLTPGQKVELYRASDDYKIGEATCQAGQSTVTFDIDAEVYPLYLYCKYYATNGTTLIEVTPDTYMCGGDTWYWGPPEGNLHLDSDAFIIIRDAGSGSPKSATLTATLLTDAGEPAPGKTLYFSTKVGTVSPSSAITDDDGQASTTLTSATQHGIAAVEVRWLGDPDVSPAIAWFTVHIFYDAESEDSSKGFQFYVEGLELEFVDGHYVLSCESNPQEWSVEIPEWNDDIIRLGLISIYRRGVKEFSGILSKLGRTTSENPNVVLGGTDSKSLSDNEIVTYKDYLNKTLLYILTDLFESYHCGITLGTVDAYSNTLSLLLVDESLISSVSRICDVIGWLYRLNLDYTLDVRPSFGITKPDITFTEGKNLIITGLSEDYRRMANYVRAKGKEALVSRVYDPDSVETYGPRKAVVFQKSLDSQATLDIAASAELARLLGGTIAIQGALEDEYDVGAWGIDDWITVTCGTVGLSGLYRVYAIRRYMTDPYYAEVDLVNKATVELGDLFDRLRRELKDLSGKITI